MELKTAILQRRSVRKFKDEKVKDEDLKQIFNIALRTASAYNGQQVSVVYTRDKAKKEKLAKLCGNQDHIKEADVFLVFLVDFKRAKFVLDKKGLEFKDNLEDIYDFAKVEVGIMLNTINLLAGEYGYGGTIIGGVLESVPEISEMFNLPDHTRIVMGLTLGVPNKPITKDNTRPKLGVDTVFMEDSYDVKKAENALFDYDKVLAKWYKDLGVKEILQTEELKRYLCK